MVQFTLLGVVLVFLLAILLQILASTRRTEGFASGPMVPPPPYPPPKTDSPADAIAGIAGALGGAISPLSTKMSGSTPSSPSTSQTTTPTDKTTSNTPPTIPTVSTGGTNTTLSKTTVATQSETTAPVAPGSVDPKNKEWVPSLDNIRTLIDLEIGKAMALSPKYSIKDTQSSDILSRVLTNMKAPKAAPLGAPEKPKTPALQQGVEYAREIGKPEPSCDPSQYIRKDKIPCYQCRPT